MHSVGRISRRTGPGSDTPSIPHLERNSITAPQLFSSFSCGLCAAESVEGEGLTRESREKRPAVAELREGVGKERHASKRIRNRLKLPFIMPSKIPPCNYQRKTICGYHKRAVAAVKFSPGGTLLGSACESTTVCPTARKRVAHFPGEFFLKCENAGSGEGLER